MQLASELQYISERTRVLRDRVLIKRFEYENPAGLAVVGVKLEKGVVVATGYGRRLRRKVAFKQHMGASGQGRVMYFEDGDETGVIRQMRVAVGDVVEFSPRNYTEVNFDRIHEFAHLKVGPLLVVWEQGIMLRDPAESKGAALMWQQSAGYDRFGNFLSGREEWARPQ